MQIPRGEFRKKKLIKTKLLYSQWNITKLDRYDSILIHSYSINGSQLSQFYQMNIQDLCFAETVNEKTEEQKRLEQKPFECNG